MAIFRRRIKIFSTKSEKMIDSIEKELRRRRVDDFEVSSTIPSDVCSLEITDNGLLVINVPERLDFFRFDVDDFVRRRYPYQNISTQIDRDLFRLKLNIPVKESEVIEIVNYIIEEQEFCTLIK